MTPTIATTPSARATLGQTLDGWPALAGGSLDPSVQQLFRRAVDVLDQDVREGPLTVDLPTLLAMLDQIAEVLPLVPDAELWRSPRNGVGASSPDVHPAGAYRDGSAC